jgi:hypothetical protein
LDLLPQQCSERSEGNFAAFHQGYVVLALYLHLAGADGVLLDGTLLFLGQSCSSSADDLFVHRSATVGRERKNLSFATCFLAVVRRRASVASNQAFAKNGDHCLQAMAESQT